MTAKSELRAVVRERLRAAVPPTQIETSWKRQVFCCLRWPFFLHAYDAVFVSRPDKSMSYYEHCAVCGRARSWVALCSNHGKPGSVKYDRTYGNVVTYR